MSKKLAMVINAGKCLDCKGCMAACKVANNLPDGYWRNWIKGSDPQSNPGDGERLYFQPGNCMQCDQASCVTACPTGATYKSKIDGAVYIDKGLCIGCGQCIQSCPYGARYRHPTARVADKCDFCADRRAVGLSPACVSTCPTKARVFGDLNDPKSEAARLLKQNKDEIKQIQNAQTKTDPNLYYLGETGNTDWTHPAQMPGAFEFWKNLASPVVKGIFGLTALGVLAMAGKQLLMKNDEPVHEPQEEDRHE